jgi:hypothetical protein
MVAFLTLDAAKQHLRVTVDDDDGLITRQVEQASVIVLDYIKKTVGTPDPDDPSIVDWDETTVPPPVAAAVAMMLGVLYEVRQAGATDNEVAMGYLPKEVTSMLHRFRDPALA